MENQISHGRERERERERERKRERERERDRKRERGKMGKMGVKRERERCFGAGLENFIR